MRKYFIIVLLAVNLQPTFAIEPPQVNIQAQQKAIQDARKLVPDTLQFDFSEAKEIYLDEYRIINDFEEGLLCIEDAVTEKCGFLNEEGEWVIPISLKLANNGTKVYFTNGYLVCHLWQNGKSVLSVIDKTGKITKLPNNIVHCSNFSADGYALAEKKININNYDEKYKLIFINPLGQEIMTTVYAGQKYLVDEIGKPYVLESERRYSADEMETFWGIPVSTYPMSSSLTPYCDYTINLWGFVDKTGKKVVPARYKYVHPFSEGLAAVQMPTESSAPEKWGFINATGQMLIPTRYSNEPEDFHDGYAIVKKTNDNYVFINKKGEVVSGEYIRANSFYHGYAFVCDDDSRTSLCINTDFEVVNAGRSCDFNENTYLWNGRKQGVYNSALSNIDFTGRKIVVNDWQFGNYKGSQGYYGSISVTNGNMLVAQISDIVIFANLEGKVKFILRRQEF